MLAEGLVVAIDGPASAGKGTLARRLAAHLGLPHLDTGLLYRATGRRVLDGGGDPADADVAEAAARALVPGDLVRGDLRGPEADRASSLVAAVPGVRAALLDFQRRFALGGAVLDGRDIGTVVCPGAAVKLFVTASLEARARRRWLEMRGRATEAGAKVGGEMRLEVVEAEMRARDEQDSTRGVAPLRAAADAVVLDTTALDAEQAFAAALEVVGRVRPGFRIEAAAGAADLEAVRGLFRAYAESLDVDLGYQGFAAELAGLPGAYAAPGGALLLARDAGGVAVGCVALRASGAGCEMKRLYVAPGGRGLGLGRALIEAVVAEAGRLGYGEIRLDTLPSMGRAQSLYLRAGFRPVAAYYETPVAGTVFLSRAIGG